MAQTAPSPSEPISPLRRRMIEDMTIRGFADKTKTQYIRHVKNFSIFFGRSPDQATLEDVRRYQLHMVTSGVSTPVQCGTISALKFFFNETLRRRDISDFIPVPREFRKLPAVLSQEEVARLLAAAPSIKARAALSVAYGAGLRASEVVSLKLSDIDGDRKVIRVEQGKGYKDRYVMLSPQLRKVLLNWWYVLKPRGWLFPGRDPVNPLSTRQLNRLCHMAADLAELGKSVSPHMLRHSFATHLLEQGVDIRVIQVLLGHQNIRNTTIYAQVATRVIQNVESPLEHLVFADHEHLVFADHQVHLSV